MKLLLGSESSQKKRPGVGKEKRENKDTENSRPKTQTKSNKITLKEPQGPITRLGRTKSIGGPKRTGAEKDQKNSGGKFFTQLAKKKRTKGKRKP